MGADKVKVTGEPDIVTQMVKGSIKKSAQRTLSACGILAGANFFSSKTMRASDGTRNSHGNCGIANVADRCKRDRSDGPFLWNSRPGKFRWACISSHTINEASRELLCISIYFISKRGEKRLTSSNFCEMIGQLTLWGRGGLAFFTQMIRPLN